MTNALLNDVAQRVLSFNKLDQRGQLRRILARSRLPAGAEVLDFGCGTGLFASVFLNAGCKYTGYDIDSELVAYARRREPRGRFVASKADLRAVGGFDLVVANCCFHHISDVDAAAEMASIADLLKAGGAFVLIDLLLENRYDSLPRRLYNRLERGAYVRQSADYRQLMESCFEVSAMSTFRSFLFSLPGNPVYNDLVVIEGEKAA